VLPKKFLVMVQVVAWAGSHPSAAEAGEVWEQTTPHRRGKTQATGLESCSSGL